MCKCECTAKINTIPDSDFINWIKVLVDHDEPSKLYCSPFAIGLCSMDTTATATTVRTPLLNNKTYKRRFYDQLTITIAFAFFVTSYRLNGGANFDINSAISPRKHIHCMRVCMTSIDVRSIHGSLWIENHTVYKVLFERILKSSWWCEFTFDITWIMLFELNEWWKRPYKVVEVE